MRLPVRLPPIPKFADPGMEVGIGKIANGEVASVGVRYLASPRYEELDALVKCMALAPRFPERHTRRLFIVLEVPISVTWISCHFSKEFFPGAIGLSIGFRLERSTLPILELEILWVKVGELEFPFSSSISIVAAIY